MARDFFDHSTRILPERVFSSTSSEKEFSVMSLIREASQNSSQSRESEIETAMELSFFDL